MKKQLWRAVLFVVVVVLCIPVQAFASETETKPKTEPPPIFFQPFTIFDPDFLYLEDGLGYITLQGNQKVTISGWTSSVVRTDTIGVKLTLQRWTGSPNEIKALDC